MLMAGDCANTDACMIQLCGIKLCLQCLLLSCSVADAVEYGDATATLAKGLQPAPFDGSAVQWRHALATPGCTLQPHVILRQIMTQEHI